MLLGQFLCYWINYYAITSIFMLLDIQNLLHTFIDFSISFYHWRSWFLLSNESIYHILFVIYAFISALKVFELSFDEENSESTIFTDHIFDVERIQIKH